MATVEELREGLIKILTDAWGGHNAAAIMMTDSIIAAARAGEAEELKADLLKRQIHCDMHGRNRCVVVPDFLLTPASVLAPKEKP
jgi:hypothetical protein